MSHQLEETRDRLGADPLLVELSRTKSSGSNISKVIKLRTVGVLPPSLSEDIGLGPSREVCSLGSQYGFED